MHTVLDKGPPQPKPLAPDATDADKAAHAALVKAHKEWHDAHKAPVEVQMHAIDATAAVANGPDRFSMVEAPPPARKMGSLDDRMSSVEERLDALEAEDKPAPDKAVPAAPPAYPSGNKPAGT